MKESSLSSLLECVSKAKAQENAAKINKPKEPAGQFIEAGNDSVKLLKF